MTTGDQFSHGAAAPNADQIVKVFAVVGQNLRKCLICDGGVHGATHKAGNHAFRFRNTYLRNYTACPEGLYRYWLGHAGKDMSDLYLRRDQRGRCIPQKVGRAVRFRLRVANRRTERPEMYENAEVAIAA
jgi:hypothetical protein